MDTETVIAALGNEWEQPQGFFGLLRQGVFDHAAFERTMAILAQVDVANERCLDRRLVALFWFIPLFMTWQRERLQEMGGDMREVDAAFHRILSHVERVLGLP